MEASEVDGFVGEECRLRADGGEPPRGRASGRARRSPRVSARAQAERGDGRGGRLARHDEGTEDLLRGMDARGKEVGDARGEREERETFGEEGGGVEGTARTSSPATRAPVASSGASERTLMIARSTASLSSGCADAELEPNKPPIIGGGPVASTRLGAEDARRSDSSARDRRRSSSLASRPDDHPANPRERSKRARTAEVASRGSSHTPRARATTATPRVPTNRAAGRSSRKREFLQNEQRGAPGLLTRLTLRLTSAETASGVAHDNFSPLSHSLPPHFTSLVSPTRRRPSSSPSLPTSPSPAPPSPAGAS